MKFFDRKIIFIFSIIFVIVMGIFYLPLNAEHELIISPKENSLQLNEFAIMLEQDDGTYKESTTNNWPTGDYSYNGEMSKCIDIKGNVLDDSLSFNETNNVVEFDTNISSTCYLYFDININYLCDSGTNLGDCINENPTKGYNNEIVAGMYRYQGEIADNYICFGTDSRSNCKNSSDKFMYRIVGIDSSGRAKLIKNTSLPTTSKWYSNHSDDISWVNTTHFSSLNGAQFLKNESYINDVWSEKIDLSEWKYGDIEDEDANQSGLEVYEVENGWTDTVMAKVGLLYIHDYFLAMSNTVNCHWDADEKTVCINSWISREGAIMDRYGFDLYYGGTTNMIWYITNKGYINEVIATMDTKISPVFNLISSAQYKSGLGTEDDPILIY